MATLTRHSAAPAWMGRSALTSYRHAALTPRFSIRSFAQAATLPSSTSASAAQPTSSPVSLIAASPSTATLPNSRLWRFRPTHRRFPLHNRFNPATPLRFSPLTPTPPHHTTTQPHTQPQPHTAPTQTAAAATVPFAISRTRSHGLPVYLDYRGGGTLVTTCVRRVDGDAEALARQWQLLVGDRAKVVARPGRVEVKGNYVDETKRWLEMIGF